jgi:hypothetical protein
MNGYRERLEAADLLAAFERARAEKNLGAMRVILAETRPVSRHSKRFKQSSQRKAMARPFSVCERRPSRG